VNKRLAVLLLIAGLGPLAALVAWPRVSEQVKTADLTLAVLTQPRAEVVASGYIKNFQAPAFSVETLVIEEPEKEPYRRLISLDAKRMFELALGQPRAGTYRVAVQTRRRDWLSAYTRVG
jgi:hypothetical protein